MKTIKDININGKKVILRAGFDMPLDENGNITDDSRIKETIPTIKYIIERARQLIIISHMGRPEGKIVAKLKNDVVKRKLEQLLGVEVIKLDSCINITIPNDKKIILLENLRFHIGEEKNDPEFAKKLASYADIYCNEAFSVMHRDAASITGITRYLPGCVGFLVEKELKYLNLGNAQRPMVAILGGSKISTKLPVINELLKKTDYLLLGGAMIFTFYKAKGYEIGKSLYEKDQLDMAKLLLNNEKLVLPTDVVVAKEIKEYAENKTVNVEQIPPEYIGLDIGEESVKRFRKILDKAKTIVWNGPLGKFETKPFDTATNDIARYLTQLNAIVIVGGGETADAIDRLGIKEKITHVSTGGGASLEMLSGKVLPGIKALEENEIEYF
ncbi:MAG: phosphoglycerate kinase [Candidatus Woesearchaeota archaeon]